MILRRFGIPALLAYVLALALHACGGGGGGDGQASTPGPGTPGSGTPGATLTATTRTPTGGTPAAGTPTPLPTQTPVRPGGSLLDALKGAAPGSTVLVAPGSYGALVVQSGDLQGPVTLLADITGSSEVVGAVTITAFDGQRSTPAAISISGVTGLTIDGVTVQGGTEEGILVLDSPNTVIRNCVVRSNHGDGVFVQSSDATLVFDSLVYQNSDAGIRIYSSNDASAISNTVYGNHGVGIFVGTASAPSAGVVVENNIVDGNLGVGIEFESGNDVFSDYNLNTDGYGMQTAVGTHDLNANPQFLAAAAGDFHLSQQLDDCTGGSPAINAGDPDTAAGLIAALQQRSTQLDNRLDCVGSGCCTTLTASPTPEIVDLQPGEVDLGYHYPAPPPTPTPKPRTPARTKTPTRTPTRTPTV
jgi:parallel beta-helix repeat protein